MSEFLEHPIFKRFYEISQIPRESSHTEQISLFLEEFGRRNGHRVSRDKAGNVVIFREASKGYENAPVVMLQGHMDMVCVRTADSDHDFRKDPIRFVERDGMLYADHTSLGSDDGMAVAYMMEILSNPSIEAPALECVITVDEEIGLLGAEALEDFGSRAEYLINLDNEEEHHFCVSCAGGRQVNIRRNPDWPFVVVTDDPDREPDKRKLLSVEVSGFLGGHSGSNIIKRGGNADIVMARVLFAADEAFAQKEEHPLFLIQSIHGGTADNVIPNRCRAVILSDDGEEAERIMRRAFEEICEELKEFEPVKPVLTVNELEKKYPCSFINPFDTAEMLYLLTEIPNGIRYMDENIPGLVSTSCSLGILNLDAADEKPSLEAVICLRSNVRARKEELTDEIDKVVNEYGGITFLTGDYPQWEFRKESELRNIMEEIHVKLYGEPPVWEAIHAGLECGIFSEKMPGLDIVSIGPDLLDIHSVEEHADIASCIRTYEYLLEVLKNIK